jgi:mannonate dehydratase
MQEADLLYDERNGKSTDKGLKRRSVLKYAVLSGGAVLAGLTDTRGGAAAQSAREETTQDIVDRATRGMPAPRIKDVKVIEVGAGGLTNVAVVKVTTDQDGLYGYGEASLTAPGGRSKMVRSAVEDYLKPLVVGRQVDRIEQIWQLCYMSSYYKNDQTQNTAIAGVCDALWDIKGRQAGMPVYQLVGGKCREAAEVYRHARATNLDPEVVEENSKRLVSEGIRNIQIDVFTRDAYTRTVSGTDKFDDGKVPYDRDLSMRKLRTAFEVFRREIPEEIKLGTDVHSLFDTVRALRFCKEAEAFKPWYWIEDAVSVADQMYLRVIRQQCATPLAFGELWNNPAEWRPLIQERLIDYIRHHVPHVGGFTAARKIAVLADNFQVKTGWHGAPLSPVGHVINLTLDLTNTNFGIHEDFGDYPDPIKEIFDGGKVVKNGHAWLMNDRPGWGVEVDEKAAAKLPILSESPTGPRLPDGSVIEGTG